MIMCCIAHSTHESSCFYILNLVFLAEVLLEVVLSRVCSASYILQQDTDVFWCPDVRKKLVLKNSYNIFITSRDDSTLVLSGALDDLLIKCSKPLHRATRAKRRNVHVGSGFIIIRATHAPRVEPLDL